MLKLQLSSLKQLFRNKEALFWSLAFPLIFILVFSLFDFSGSVNARIIVIDNADNEISNQIIDSLQHVKGVGINENIDNQDEATNKLKNSENVEFTFYDQEKDETYTESAGVNVVLVFPEGYGNLSELEKNQEGSEIPFKLDLIYNESDEGGASPSGIVESIVNSITSEINLNIAGGKNLFDTEREGISVNEVSYYDILVPGIIGMGIMQSGVIGMATNIATLKEKRVLKRLSATPLPIWKFLFTEIFTFLILTVLQVTIMLVFAKFLLGASIYGNVALIYFLSFISSFVFLSLGFIAAALSKTANAASSLSNVVSMPMMFLSGVFFDRETLPHAVKIISDFLPLSPLIDALRAVSIQNKSIFEVKTEILIIAVWTVVAFVIAAKLFKFREE